MGYKVLVPELNVLEAIGEFKDLNNNLIGYDHRSNTFFEGEIVPDSKVSPVIKKALEDKDPDDPTFVFLNGKLERSGENGSVDTLKRIGVPLANYDDLSETEVIDALRVLSAPLISAVKEYESLNQKRSGILEYNAGLREGVRDRIDGIAGSEGKETDPGKVSAEFQTREVTSDDVTLGDGYTGSESDREVGASESEDAKPAASSKRRTSKPSTRKASAKAPESTENE